MITISNLSNKKSDKSYSFSDLNLNFEEKQVSNNRRNSDVVSGNDLVIDTDINAVKNSIRNILSQTRHLTPSLNVNLQSYIGTNISEMNALALGNAIDRGINLFEPRVKLQKVLVAPDLDNMTYQIALILTLVNFNNTTVLNAILSNNGNFAFVNS